MLSVRSAQLQPRGTLDEIVLFHLSVHQAAVSTTSSLHRHYDGLAKLRVLPSPQLVRSVTATAGLCQERKGDDWLIRERKKQ